MQNKTMQDAKGWMAIITGYATFFMGWGLLLADFILPPLTEVHDSSLWVLGQSLIYVGSVIGLTQYMNKELRDFKFKYMRDTGHIYDDKEEN